MKELPQEFFARSPKKVARDLLGKVIIRKWKTKSFVARIVEVEAYFDERDPASRACKKGDLKATMQMEAGTLLVYGIHNQWLFNIVTGKKGKAAAVLLRALEPLNFEGKCNGPGLLTKQLHIEKSLHKKNIFAKDLQIRDEDFTAFEIAQSFRIGVTKDLPQYLRYYIKNNPHVSRK